MSYLPDTSKPMEPLKTWSHLAGDRRRPTEYEVVSTNLLWSTKDPKAPWAMGPGTPLTKWFVKYRNESPLVHDDWDAFRDPDKLVYRTYTMMQDGQENYIDGLLDEHSKNDHDATMPEAWPRELARFYTPSRYLIHAVQMASAYLVQLARSSTIENCCMFQAADQYRWVCRIAYRTSELAKAHPDLGFGEKERQIWEDDPAWDGFRELVERTLVTYDWGEHFAALQLVAKPCVDEAAIRQLGRAAKNQGDTLLGMLSDAQLIDSERSRRWTKALVEFVDQNDRNRALLKEWIEKWTPLGDRAIDAYCAALPGIEDAADQAKAAVRRFRADLGFRQPQLG